MTGLPLAGYRVLVTRPVHQSDALVDAIENAGGAVVRFPVMQIVGRQADIVAAAFSALPDPDVVIFVSKNAVEYGVSAVAGSKAKIAAIGPTTRAAIESSGLGVEIHTLDGFDSQSLLAHPSLQDVRNRNVTIIRGESGRELLAETLTKRGANVSYLSAYRREIRLAPEHEVDSLSEDLVSRNIDCVTVMSVESLKNLLQLLPAEALEALRETPLVAPGARVIQTALELIPGVKAVAASGPQAADMLKALISTRHSGQNS